MYLLIDDGQDDVENIIELQRQPAEGEEADDGHQHLDNLFR